jgi:precorrin-6B methylase 2
MTQNSYLPEQVLIPHFGDKPIVGVEIGVLGASGTVAMMNRMPHLKLYAIDPWKHFDKAEYEAENSQEYHDENYDVAKHRTEEFGDRVMLMKMTSDEALPLIPEVDFVHIDGDHRYEQVKKDIHNYKQKVKPGGIISGHDWWLDHIKKAVHEELGEDIILGEDGVWIKKL